MKRRIEVFHKGRRYWATLRRRPSDGKPQLAFWSSHKWPFYHGHYTPDKFDRDDCWAHFVAWLPFRLDRER